jgi:hypothetical protein
MDYTFTVEQMPGYLHVKVAGVNSPQTVRRYMADVRAVCSQRRCPHVLIEENLDGPSLSPTAVYAVVCEATANAWPAVTKIAFVDVNPQHDQALMKFAETVAVNRGVEVSLFKDVADAGRWLTAGSP